MSEKFHERFEIAVDVEAVRRRFVNRVDNLIFGTFLQNAIDPQDWSEPIRYVASRLGDKFVGNYLAVLAESGDFLRHLEAVEAFYDWCGGTLDYDSSKLTPRLDQLVTHILSMSEVDLGVRWEHGQFRRHGARLLDDRLVNDPLGWLRAKGYETVYTPFEKSLAHLLRAERDPSLLSDVVTDGYEALEALAKVVTGRDADLSANRELFNRTVKASDEYKVLLQGYISYANAFRHAAELGRSKPAISLREAESFVYMTGVFVRLAMS